MRLSTGHITRRALLTVTTAAMLTAALGGCSPSDTPCSRYTAVPRDGWRYGDTITFVPEHPGDSVKTADMVLSLRHTPDYPYSNVWLEVTVAEPPRRDTVNVPLCDKYGHWYGNGIGVSYQLSHTVARGVSHVTGTPVTVRHIMRADTLTGIEQLGIALL